LRRPEAPRRRLAGARGWIVPAALFTLAPKCVLCALAYAGAGTALGFGGPEICGGVSGPWTGLPAVVATGLGVIGGVVAWNRHRRAA